MEDFSKNCLGELSNSSSRRWTHDCFGEISSNSPRRVVQCIYRNSIVSFREQKSFVLKIVILLAFGLCMCDGVGEDSGHGIGHVDIRVGSCNCLDVCFSLTCAFRWGVTHVGNYLYWVLLTLSMDHYFRYRECTGGRCSLESAFRRKPGFGFARDFCITCIKIVNF